MKPRNKADGKEVRIEVSMSRETAKWLTMHVVIGVLGVLCASCR